MTTIPPEAFFVSTAWLAEHLGAPDVAVIDGTFFLPDEKRDAKADYLEGHIPGAVFFDIDAIADHTTNLPHMLPHPSGFAEAMEKLGLGDGMRFVVSFRSSGRVTKNGSKLSAISPSGAEHHWRNGSAGFLRNLKSLSALPSRG